MNALPKISVIVPVYNAEPWLRRCVESIEAQSWPCMQLLLVNDGSRDKSLLLCHALATQYPNIVVYDQPNGGAAAARNAGLVHADGEFIGFVDADDFIEPDMYETMCRAMERCGADIACCGRVKETDGVAGAPQLTLPEEVSFGRDDALRRFFAFDGLEESICDKLYRAPLAKSHRFVTGSVCEDILYAWDTLQEAKTVCHIGSKPMYHYCFESAKPASASAGSFTESCRARLDYPRHIYAETKQKYPALAREAQSYYLRRLLDIYAEVHLCGADRTPGPAKAAAEEFRRQVPQLLTNPYVPREKKKAALVFALHAEKAVAAAGTALRKGKQHGKA